MDDTPLTFMVDCSQYSLDWVLFQYCTHVSFLPLTADPSTGTNGEETGDLKRASRIERQECWLFAFFVYFATLWRLMNTVLSSRLGFCISWIL